MTIKQMEYFISVCQTTNMTKSAEELYISQPTLSISMKNLENEVCVPLFHKNGNRLVLTEAGEILRDEILKVFEQYESMENRIHSGVLNRNYICFGFSTIVGNTVASSLYGRFRNEHPEVRIQTLEDYGYNLLHQLDNGRLDVVVTGGFYSMSEEWKDRFNTYTLTSSVLRYYILNSKPLAYKKNVSIGDIAKEPIIMLNESYPVARVIEQNFRDRNLPLNVVLRTSQMYTVERFVSIGIGGGFLPSESGLNNASIIQIDCKELEEFQKIPINLYWKKSSTQYPSLKKFIETTKKVFPNKIK